MADMRRSGVHHRAFRIVGCEKDSCLCGGAPEAEQLDGASAVANVRVYGIEYTLLERQEVFATPLEALATSEKDAAGVGLASQSPQLRKSVALLGNHAFNPEYLVLGELINQIASQSGVEPPVAVDQKSNAGWNRFSNRRDDLNPLFNPRSAPISVPPLHTIERGNLYASKAFGDSQLGLLPPRRGSPISNGPVDVRIARDLIMMRTAKQHPNRQFRPLAKQVPVRLPERACRGDH